MSAVLTSNSQTVWSQARTYDNVGNVLGLTTTVPSISGGTKTDVESFCYDALDRLVWAGDIGNPTGGDHCGSTPSGTNINTYQQSYSYDDLDRMTSGPSGTMTYGAPNHVHAVTGLSTVANQYATYNADGEMVCRNIASGTGHTCGGGSSNGAAMTYDAAGRLATWTAPGGTTASDSFLYDNAGNRVLQTTSNTSNGTTTTTDTITFDGYTETSITNGATTTIKYYSLNGQKVAMHWNGTLYYLLSDSLGSSTVALKDDGTTQAAQLFAPYGAVRHSSGTMPTTYNFTGQRLDSETGLLYYNFRYYDPVSGRFVRADTVDTNAKGMDPYAYVGDSPENKGDPTGHRYADTVTDGLNYTTTAILISSSVYGGLSSNAHVQIRFFQEYITDPKNADPMVRSYVNERTRPSTVDNRVRDATTTVEELEDKARTFERFGYGLLVAGALVDGILSGLQYYDQHKNQGVGAAIGVGVVHALLFTAGTIIGAAAGEDLGGAIGTLLIPIPGVGTVIGATIGGAIFGAAGGYVGDQLASAWEPAAASVGSAVASGLGSASAWVGSLF